MAKKKKTKQVADARGYQTTASSRPKQQAPTSAPASTSRSSSAAPQMRVTLTQQEKLEHLLELLLQYESTTSHKRANTALSSGPPPTITERKVATLLDHLTRLGVATDLIRQVVLALARQQQQQQQQQQQHFTLPAALDWICLHVATDQLPPILTEGLVRDELVSVQQQQSTESLQVLYATTTTTNNSLDESNGKHDDEHLRHENTLKGPVLAAAKANSDLRIDLSGQDEEDRRNDRARLLEQYAYTDDDEIADQDEDSDDKDAARLDAEDDEKINNTRKVQVSSDAAVANEKGHAETFDSEQEQPPPNDSVTSAERVHLQDLEQQLQTAQFDLRDEASNYMRSKAEIKQIQALVKTLQKQVQKLQTKVAEKERSTTTKSMDEEDALLDDEGDDSAGLFDMFGDTDHAATASADEQVSGVLDDTQHDVIEIPDTAIMKSWTGALPKDVLKDWCHKEKIKPPRFSGQQVTLALIPPLTIVEDKRLSASKSNTEHYLSTKALYQLQPDRPLYGMLPPFYRDLWKQWLADRKQVASEVSESLQAERQAKIDELMRLVREITAGSALETKRQVSEDIDGEVNDGVPKSWEEIENEECNTHGVPKSWEGTENKECITHVPRQSSLSTSERLKHDFVKQCTTSAYQVLLVQRKELPMYAYRAEFLSTVAKNPVTVVYAQTGAGKTTQCPQFLLEEALLNSQAHDTMILCSQPRRIAAVSVAERVSEEMADTYVGKRVGYQIRLDSRRSSDTKLLFCTTGIVLRQLVDNPLLTGISHVIVDEVHERQWQVDLLLVTLRNLITGPRRDLKVVLMSATLDAQLFCAYFGEAPLVSVPGRTFPVTSYNLEHLLQVTGHVIEEGSRYAVTSRRREDSADMYITTKGGEKRRESVSLDSPIHDEVSLDYPDFPIMTRRSLDRVDESVINFDLIEDVLQLLLIERDQSKTGIVAPHGADISRGSILVFMPGLGEIRTLVDRLQGSRVFGNGCFDFIPLHSTLSSLEQKKAFKRPEKGRRKIIIATNIAETSVTIPDVVIVLDTGRARELTVDKATGTPKLVVSWCSRASVRQRSGRAGRVQPGICLKLFSSKTERSIMKERSEPELRRIPLEEVCLNILSSGSALSCRNFLGLTPQPPLDEAVQAAVDGLKLIGAVLVENASHPEKEQLTPLGQLLVRLPVHPRLGKMLIYGALFQCIDSIASIAACLSSSQSVFLSGYNNFQQAKAAHTKFQHINSDFLTLYNVYDAFQKAQSRGEAQRFCKSNFLSLPSLREVQDAKAHYLSLLSSLGLVEQHSLGLNTRGRMVESETLRRSPANKFGGNEAVLHSVICSGMYPFVGRLKERAATKGSCQMMHKTETLDIHGTSVNSRLISRQTPSQWMCFHEKFGTSSRVTVSTTCFINPVAILLFCSSMEIKHLEREVLVDGWISLRLAAKSSVIFQELRSRLQDMLAEIIDSVSSGETAPVTALHSHVTTIIDGVVAILD